MVYAMKCVFPDQTSFYTILTLSVLDSYDRIYKEVLQKHRPPNAQISISLGKVGRIEDYISNLIVKYEQNGSKLAVVAVRPGMHYILGNAGELQKV